MTVRMYSSLDTGAPVLPNVSGQRLLDNLRLILKACLVDGYGVKPAAGWVVGHEHADGFSFGNGGGYINFVHQAADACALYLMEAITDSTTALAGGVNRRSGPWYDGSSATERQYFRSTVMGTAANKRWSVIADDKTCILYMDADSSAGIFDYLGGVYFGSAYNALGAEVFVSLGGGLSSGSWASFVGEFGASLRNPFSGLVGQGTYPLYAPYIASGYLLGRGLAPTAVAPGGFHKVRVGFSVRGPDLTGSARTRAGMLRGMVSEPFVSLLAPSVAMSAVGFSPFTLNDRVRPLTIGGQQFAFFLGGYTDPLLFVSLDSTDWEPPW